MVAMYAALLAFAVIKLTLEGFEPTPLLTAVVSAVGLGLNWHHLDWKK